MKDWQQKVYNEYKDSKLLAKKNMRRNCGKTWLLVHIAMVGIAEGKIIYIKSINSNMTHLFVEQLIKRLIKYNIPRTNRQIITRLPPGFRENINVFIYDEVDYSAGDLIFTINKEPKIISLRTGRE